MIKLAQPYIPEAAIKKAVEVLKSGNLIQGRYVREFETALEEYLGVKNAILVSSGTAALHLSLMALGIKQGDEIIVPAFTFPATANVVVLVGARPIFVDCTLADFCIDGEKIEAAITNRTKAIIPVHEFGQPAEMENLTTLVKKYDLAMIEDAACALGAEYNNQKIGTFGTVGCFSFHPRKTITTGEGGAVVTNNDTIAETIRTLRNHGIVMRNGTYDFVCAGGNYRMTDFQAVLGLYQLSEIETFIRRRITIAKEYDNNLSKIKGITIPAEFPNRRNVYQTYHVLVDDGINRDRLIHRLKHAGVETNLGAQALHCLTYYKNTYDYREMDFPIAAKAFRKGMALPIGPHLTGKDVHMVSEILNDLVMVLSRD